MKTATIALLFATSVVDAAEAAKADAKKTDAAATGAPEGQACNSKTDKTGCSTGLKCAIGMKADPTPAEKKKADEAAKLAAEKAQKDGQAALDKALAAAIVKWNADTAKVKAYADAKAAYTAMVTAETTCKAVLKARTDANKVCDTAIKGDTAGFVVADKMDLKKELVNAAAGSKTKTNYACLLTKHTWAADAAQTLDDMTWTAAKSATLTAKFDQCTVDAVKYTDKAACAAAVKANKKEIDDANEFNKTAADADKKSCTSCN
jgi:hypothetical protein